jgi:hypothetical protein
MLPCNSTTSRRTSAQRCQSSNHKQPSPGSRQSHIESPTISEETEGTSSIVPHRREQHDIFLSAFKAIHSFDFDLSELLGTVRAQSVTEAFSVIRVHIEQVVQQGNLGYVWGDDSNIVAAQILGIKC